MSLTGARRRVANDNDCLFTSIGYLCEVGGSGRGMASTMRRVVAERVGSDSETFSAAVLGMGCLEYQQWIRNHFNWGGELEIVILAGHFDVQIAVVSCESGTVLTYNGDAATRVYLLYTGQHYDPLVAEGPAAEETRRFDASADLAALERGFLEIAAAEKEAMARRLAEKRVKKLKCNGCGTLCDSSEAFQAHCFDEAFAERHGDDFDYMCVEVEVVVKDGEDTGLDLSDAERVYTFYDTVGGDRLSNAALLEHPLRLRGREWRSVQHFALAARFVESAPDIAKQICACGTVAEARALSLTSDEASAQEGWDEAARFAATREAMRAKFGLGGGADPAAERSAAEAQQARELCQLLLDTGDRTIALVDGDAWAGVQALGGVTTGKNCVGRILQEIRDALRATAE